MGRYKFFFGLLFTFSMLSILGFSAADQIQINPVQTATPLSDQNAVPQNQIILANPTQTPYIIYVVITATPEPAAGNPVAEAPAVVDTSNSQCVVQLDNGSTCTMALEVVSEPTFASGVKVTEGEVFYKEWEVRNTGTCTWTKDYQFEFAKGWQIGNTRFNLRKDTAPGETVNVQLGMTALLPPGDQYYSTYVLKSPTGVGCGEITSKYTVVSAGYYSPTKRPGPPRPGRPAPDDPHYPPQWNPWNRWDSWDPWWN
jgi:hypothetical protein